MMISPVVKAILALCLFFLSINDVVGNMISPLLRIDQVIEADQKFLKTSLKSSLKHFAVFSAAVGGLAAIKDSEIFGIAIGKIATPFYITVKFSTDGTTDPNGQKQLFSVGSNYMNR